MSRRLYPHKRVRYWHAYDTDEVCALFADLGLHAQTVRKWIKNGLKTIDGGKPALIYGNDLIAHLKKSNTAHKCKTAFGEFFCMGCRDARAPFQNKVAPIPKAQFIQVKAICRACKAPMFKSYKMADLPALRRAFTLVDVSQLYDGAPPTGKTHIQAQAAVRISESRQGVLL